MAVGGQLGLADEGGTLASSLYVCVSLLIDMLLDIAQAQVLICPIAQSVSSTLQNTDTDADSEPGSERRVQP